MRVTDHLLDVLEVLLQADSDDVGVHGWALAQATNRYGPTVYGVLDRLEDMSWVDGHWVDNPVEGKPRRRFYRLTPEGIARARDLLKQRRPGRGPAR